MIKLRKSTQKLCNNQIFRAHFHNKFLSSIILSHANDYVRFNILPNSTFEFLL